MFDKNKYLSGYENDELNVSIHKIDETEFRVEYEKVRQEILNGVMDATKEAINWDDGVYQLVVEQSDNTYSATLFRHSECDDRDNASVSEEIVLVVESDSLSDVLNKFASSVENALKIHLENVGPPDDDDFGPEDENLFD